jgi:hypothetical protein
VVCAWSELDREPYLLIGVLGRVELCYLGVDEFVALGEDKGGLSDEAGILANVYGVLGHDLSAGVTSAQRRCMEEIVVVLRKWCCRKYGDCDTNFR